MSNLSNIIVQLKDSQSTFLEKLQVIEKETGNASEEILRDLIQDAREIHEGTVLLSYLVYNESNSAIEEVQPEITFKEDPEEDLLMSALDSAIENTQKNIVRTMDEPQIVREINDVKAIIEEVEEAPKQEEMISELENSISDVILTHSSEPVVAKPVEVEDNSLAAKLAKKKIENLVTAVGINEKFLFTNELFDGNTEHFIKTINELNNLASFEEANGYLSNLVTKNNWETEEAPYLKLLALVERKFL
jgi:hypothetical protein